MNEVINLVIVICIQAACVVVCGNIMRAKERGLHLGQFIGFMLGILGIAVCLLWPPKVQKHKTHKENIEQLRSNKVSV